jgi:asparagine synthase (glutamine-hydrolysing)
MCGISGIINWNGIQDDDVRKVKDSLLKMSYRGPDSTNIQKDFNTVLGHNRLAIVDLNPRSNQPMQTVDGNYTIVFNGELYNYKELKVTLENLGKTFIGTSDTEVLLQGYAEYGSDVVNYIRGMFAFVIWDNQKNEVFVARDRFGEKPFYYFLDDKCFSFASNLSGIVALKNNQPTISKQALYELLSQQYIDTTSCIYEGIYKLPPACSMKLTSESCEIKPYWNPDYTQKNEADFETHKTKLHHLLQDAVNEQLVADVPVGLFLSGGVDSTVITALASQQKKDITAITMSVPNNKAFDESKAATFVAKKLNINHQIVALDNSCVESLPYILKTIEPLADASLIPTMAIANAAHKEFKVMLSGDGGDELFGGYKRPVVYNENSFSGNKITQQIVSSVIKKSDLAPFNYFYSKLNDKRIYKWAGLKGFYENKSLPNKQFKGLLKTSENLQNKVYEKYLEAEQYTKDEADKILYVGVKSNLVDDFLFKMDSANMFYSVESRAPFLDHRILDYTSQLTINELMPNGIDKEILKSIGCDYLPKEFFTQPKKGFSIPYYDYLKTTWGTLLSNFLKEGISSDLNLIDSDISLRLLESYRKKPTFKLGKILYSILVFEIWLRVFHLQINPEEIKMN